MDDADLTTNAITVINAVEKKLPNGEKNIKRILVKTTMGPVIKQVIQARKKGQK